MSKCPVDHSQTAPSNTSAEACPVDHSTRSIWDRIFASSPAEPSHSPVPSQPTAPHGNLSSAREISSIPRHESSPGDESDFKNKNWVYPSESQFFQAMARKNHNPQERDMRTIVPIHNAVNERAWAHILDWEDGRGATTCGGPRLVSFQGKPQERTPKARWKMLFGYSAPFDRHDWVVDRCGTRIRYVIDFYTGRPLPGSQQVSFYLDVRPALDNWEGVKMRADMFWRKLWNSSPMPESKP